MQIKPIYIFDNEASTGIDEVPVDSIVIVKNNNNFETEQVLKEDLGTLTALSTIGDFLAETSIYSPVGVLPIMDTVVSKEYTAGAGQEELLVTYDPSKDLSVYKNGLLMRNNTYSAISPYTITFNPALILNDWIQLKYYDLDLPLGAYDIDTAVYDNNGAYYGSYNCYDFVFSGDGTSFVTLDSGTLHNLSLNGPFDLSTIADATPTSPAIGSNYYGMCYSLDGMIMMVVDQSTKEIKSYQMVSPFNPSGATLISTITTILGYGKIDISPDGRKLFLVEYSGAYKPVIYEHVLSTPYDLTTFNNTEDKSSVFPASINALSFDLSGTRLYVIYNGTEIRQYALSVAWDITSKGTYKVFTETANGTGPTALRVSADGTILVVHFYSNHGLMRYKLGT